MVRKWRMRAGIATVALALIFGTTGCGSKGETPEILNNPVAISSGPATSYVGYDLTFTEKDIDTSYNEDQATSIVLESHKIVVTGEGAKAKDNILTINQGGTYLLKGELNGQVIVEVPETEEVQLVLHGVSIHNEAQPSLYIKEGGKAFLTLVADQRNKFSARGEFTETEENMDGVIYSQGDLTINGTGALEVQSNYNHGIVARGELKVTGGKIAITSPRGGLFGKDAIKIKDGNFVLKTQEDGIHSQNGEDEHKGFIYVAGGNFDIQSHGNGFQAETLLQIDSGNFNITTGERNNDPKLINNISSKGFKAGKEIIINEGSYDLNTSADGIYSNGRLVITGGTIALNSDADGLHADGDLTITGGILLIEKSYEGITGNNIVITGGIVDVVAEDDGFNVAGGKDGSALQGSHQKNYQDTSSVNFFRISGGEIRIIANGDGLDINGDLFIDGGKLILSSLVSDGNSAFDFKGKAVITGGTLMATGSSVTARNFSGSSTQYSVLHNLANIINAGSEVTITDASGKVILNWIADKDFCSVQFSSPDFVEKGAYTLTSDSITEEIILNSIVTSNEALLSTATSGVEGVQLPVEMGKLGRN